MRRVHRRPLSEFVRTVLPAAAVMLAPTLAPAQRAEAVSGDTAPPPVAREFRGVWVATVANIDWPSRPGLDSWAQQRELIAILDRAVALHLNAIVLQVRPEADAFYDSKYEPWSAFLNGAMGRRPEPYYDPLAFAVREAHARGLQLHAWFNPYRALHPATPGDTAPGHVARSDSALVLQYGRYLWMDPGDPRVVARSVRALVDVVRRYDVDGVHIDDYFYPYPENDSAGRPADFPDTASWRRYLERGGTLARDDWRRANVDRLVEALYREVHRAKPWVQVGISPFGLWRPRFPEGSCCFDAYANLYADSRAWLQRGWVDYLTPQLYWPIARAPLSFPRLLAWWVAQDTLGRPIWPGIDAHLASDTGRYARGATEVLDQVALARQPTTSPGEIFFSMKAFVQDPDSLAERLARGPYASPAIVPAMPWLGRAAPRRPHAHVHRDSLSGDLLLEFHAAGGATPRLWLIQTRAATGEWETLVLPAGETVHLLAARGAPAPTDVRVRGVGRTGVLGAEARLRSTALRSPKHGRELRRPGGRPPAQRRDTVPASGRR